MSTFDGRKDLFQWKERFGMDTGRQGVLYAENPSPSPPGPANKSMIGMVFPAAFAIHHALIRASDPLGRGARLGGLQSTVRFQPIAANTIFPALLCGRCCIWRPNPPCPFLLFAPIDVAERNN